ncbi:MAG TPA: ABC transporter substrate-binding protein, partial [Acidimicrobiia bacterium]|nr:ABC transporter substrate-binding protein [Acidimicrobiia bacterium]
LRELFEEIAPSTTLDEALERGSPARAMPSWIPAAALVAAIVLVVSIGVWLSRSGDPVADTTPTEPTTVTTTTTLSTTTTTEAPGAVPDRPVYGGVVRMGVDLDYPFGTDISLNPFADHRVAPVLARLVTPGAFRVDPATGDLIPSLVESIPTVANGGVVVGANGVVTVSYRIREDAAWEDGTPITVTDFIFTHELLREHLSGTGLPNDVSALVASITGEGGDVVVTLTRPDPRYLLLFEWVLPAHAVDPDTFETEWTERLWLSGGPFRFVSFDAAAGAGEVLAIFERNPNYWEERLPYLDGIEVVRLGSAFDGIDPVNASVTLVRDGTVDMVAGYGFPFPAEPMLRSAVEVGLDLGAHYDGIIEFMLVQSDPKRLEHNPSSRNGDPEYRRALLSAISRQALASATGGQAFTSISAVGFPAWDHDGWVVYDDVPSSQAFIEQLEAAPVAVFYSTTGGLTIDIGDEIVRQLTALGWDATAEYGGFDPLLSGDFDIGALRGVSTGPAGLGGLELLTWLDPFGAETLFDWRRAGTVAAEYRELVAEANAELDRARLQELMRAAEQVLIDAAVVYPLTYRQATFNPFWPDRVGGYVPSASPSRDTASAAWWWSPRG